MTYKHFCEKCDYKCRDISNWDKHIATKKHNSIKTDFECRACNYTCSIKSLMDKHMNTQRHNTKIKQVESIQNETELQPKPNDKDDGLMEIVKQLLTQNNDLKNFIIEQAAEHKKETIDMVNKVIENVKPVCNITNNTSNKAFNINMYLNEQCKDAMNFSDFINGIEVSHEDLENNAQLGFVGGVSKILIDNLKLMNRNERPIHCTDVKRETMYIKDDNKWTKEENDSKLRSAIQEITRKSISTLMAWKRGNPESDDMDSKFSNRCIVIQQQSMAGYNREVYYPKVIHAIAREVFVSK
jgi:hypothetical protein